MLNLLFFWWNSDLLFLLFSSFYVYVSTKFDEAGAQTTTGANAIKKFTPSLGIPYLGV